MSKRSRAAVTLLREFAARRVVNWNGKTMSWAEYLEKMSRNGRRDEETLVSPVVFPLFAKQLLGWDLQTNLAAEHSLASIRPDFTPADAVTHPFVFEVKGTDSLTDLSGHEAQLRRYLNDGAPRIKKVVITNLRSARVYDLDALGELHGTPAMRLDALLLGDITGIGDSAEAERFADFLDEFGRKKLTSQQKIERVKEAPEWSPLTAVTSSDWIVGRIDRIVQLLRAEATSRIEQGVLNDSTVVMDDDRSYILTELQELAQRLGIEETEALTIDSFANAPANSVLGKALAQFAGHIAFYTAAKLILVRVWEDLKLLSPMLYDGGFAKQMERFDNTIRHVIHFAYDGAKAKYRSLFDRRNAYSWFEPTDDTYVDVVYELASTYLGGIESDVLGRVYERMLERIDRKLLGVYYTPRDIISLMWDMIDLRPIMSRARKESRTPRVLDVATGSGGFLVEAAARLRRELEEGLDSGADTNEREWLADVAAGLTGVEYQRFAAYLAELNLVVLLSPVIARDPRSAIPELGIINGDTLTFHNPEMIEIPITKDTNPILGRKIDREDELSNAIDYNKAFDVAVGNPPYIGEKLASPILQQTRRNYPYWEQFVGPHMDYLYWFLILGISKLSEGGRFSFITTEYWLRAAGAAPLREYIAEHADIERIVLFRDFRLFPDAKGQHSLIVVGTRREQPSRSRRPRVSIYTAKGDPGSRRADVLDAIRKGSSNSLVSSFSAGMVIPKGRLPWAELLLNKSQLDKRKVIARSQQVPIVVSKGIETTINSLSPSDEQELTPRALSAVGKMKGRPGVQLLSVDEVEGLGELNAEEQQVLRTWVNTRDIYPYAVVPPEDSSRVIYLAKPNESGGSDSEVVTATPFPTGLPNIEARLGYFREFLSNNTRAKNERRPWWSLHRPRSEVVGDGNLDFNGWAPFALTTRWGEGKRLIVGLAPVGSAPASGLHIIRPAEETVSSAYLVGLYNSTLFQDLAQTLPPGQLRQADLLALGVPRLEFLVGEIEANVYNLASLVREFVARESAFFPSLPEIIRADVTLETFDFSVWTPSKSLDTLQTGSLLTSKWARVVVTNKRGRIGAVEIASDLFGESIQVYSKSEPEKVIAYIQLTLEPGDKAIEALSAMILELGHRSGCAADLEKLRVPVGPAELTGLKDAADQRTQSLVNEYKRLRLEIDSWVEQGLAP